MELWDIYDIDRVRTGRVAQRGKPASEGGLGEGEYHLVVHICVFNGRGQLLLQQRQKDKEGYPNLWDVSAAGSALAGEDSRTAAVRELYEETGIKVEKEELILFDHVITSRIFSDTYLLRLAEEPKIALQSTETVDYAWLTPVELLERCREGMVIGHLAERFARYAVMLEDVLQKEGEK